MCGIFGVLTNSLINLNQIPLLAEFSERRGRDSSGIYFVRGDQYELYRATEKVTNLLSKIDLFNASFLMGHSRLITNGLSDNQPVFRDSVCVIHNGIIVNEGAIWSELPKKKIQEIDTEAIAAFFSHFNECGLSVEATAEKLLSLFSGVVSCAVALPRKGKLCLISNNGSLYTGVKDDATFFASEAHTLRSLGCESIAQVLNQCVVWDIPLSEKDCLVHETTTRTENLIPSLGVLREEERLLEYSRYRQRRCTRCILPETMPYIRFDDQGVCNYCRSYKPRNKPKPVSELFDLVKPFRREKGEECIVPFSGGRDSCYGLHLIAKELKLKPIAYTYDWGMVTDLGRRNISRMCSILGVENIIVADDISLKRRNIARNLTAWLKSPHLGMVSILTAGDKHFFRHIETVKKETGISLNLWGVNPLEVTHFKAGFLGVPPDFEEERVYSHGALKQLRYQWLRLKAMLESPGYFNRSLWDTLSGEYYRSFHKKSDYFHIFDYWRWDERQIDETLLNEYDWEKAPDTRTTWRIGDGTAAFYNYIYYTVAGFTEHDTFRSNQIREGDLSREEAMVLIEDENQPRYPNIKWYLDAIGMDFSSTIKVINAIPKLVAM